MRGPVNFGPAVLDFAMVDSRKRVPRLMTPAETSAAQYYVMFFVPRPRMVRMVQLNMDECRPGAGGWNVGRVNIKILAREFLEFLLPDETIGHGIFRHFEMRVGDIQEE